jgi:phosphohistidine phosphatase
MPTIELHLLRHAHAGDPSKWRGDDFERPLSSKGRDQADRLGRHLAAIGFATDALITSPRARARQTAEIVAGHLHAPVRLDTRLAEPISAAVVEAILDDAGRPARPVLVGHDPDFSELLALLTGAGAIALRKGALARVDVERPLTLGEGALAWLLPPELLATK